MVNCRYGNKNQYNNLRSLWEEAQVTLGHEEQNREGKASKKKAYKYLKKGNVINVVEE